MQRRVTDTLMTTHRLSRALAWLPAMCLIMSACGSEAEPSAGPGASAGGAPSSAAAGSSALANRPTTPGLVQPPAAAPVPQQPAPITPTTPVAPPPAAAPAPGLPAPGAPAQPPAAPVKAPVLVDAADEASCDGLGAAPSPDETVEVIKVRTSDMGVVPGGYTAPGGTVYACFWAEIDMPEKHHIIGWEGAVGGDRSVHHQQVSLAAKPFYLFQQGGLCGLPTVDYTWTGEKPTEWTPKLAGYPVGGPENNGKARFVWQVHFESATTYSGGFNVYVTKNLRKYDAGNFEQGDVQGINIPPMAAATHTATCTAEMTRQKLTHPIYVFASMQHAHLMIRHIKSDLTREGMHVKNFGDQMAAGFAGFFDQQFKTQSPCVKIMPGDELTTVCDYQNPTNFMITGGEATNQEMCTTFFQYFPRLPDVRSNFCGTIDSSGGFAAQP
ncbi:MAG: hypothetical protein ABW321_11020 [Polyangiales bacterium]